MTRPSSIGNGVQFLNRHLSSRLFHDPDSMEPLLEFMRIHKHKGQVRPFSNSWHNIRVMLQPTGTFRLELRGSLWLSFGCFAHMSITSLHLWWWCLEVVFGFERRETCFDLVRAKVMLGPFWHVKIEFDAQSIDIGCSLLKPPHYLRACTKKFPNMEGGVCKTTNSQLKVMLNLRITLIYLYHVSMSWWLVLVNRFIKTGKIGGALGMINKHYVLLDSRTCLGFFWK